MSNAGFKQQNAIHGLPLELAAEEVTLAVEKNWGIVRPLLGTAAQANGTEASQKPRKRQRWKDEEDVEEEDSEEEVGDGSTVTGSGPSPRQWQTALAKGSHYEIPMRPQDVESYDQEVAVSRTNNKESSMNGEEASWNYPRNTQERHRYAVFKDLQSKGFRITGGSKFGADFLLYPGDPTLYHAQFCVRLYPVDTPIVPAVLAAACRGSFQARKHLLAASVLDKEEGEPDIMYTTFGPVDGFG